MHRLIEKYIGNGFADFAGLAIAGTVPVRQELLNELLAALLSSPPSSEAPGSAADGIDTQALLRLVKKAEIRADAGVVTLEFELRA